MHYGADAFSFNTAEVLRKTMTQAECNLWEELKNKKFNGLKFRRQHPIDRFVVDFYCHEHRLVIELDGDIHNQKDVKANDSNRESELQNFGLKILRFKNEEVFSNIQNVLEKINEYICADNDQI